MRQHFWHAPTIQQGFLNLRRQQIQIQIQIQNLGHPRLGHPSQPGQRRRVPYHPKAGPFQGRLLLWAHPSEAPAKAASFQPLATPTVLRFGPPTGGGIETSPKLSLVLRFSAGEQAGFYGPCPNWVTNWD